MNTYVITLSERFPVTHPRHGQPTQFVDKFKNARYDATNVNSHYDVGMPNVGIKLHTIRANYRLWAKRFAKINTGQACLSVRVWSGKPYASKQIEIARLKKDDGIGIQKLVFDNSMIDPLCYPIIGDGLFADELANDEELAANDGLSLEDWRAWFKDYDKTKPLAIIHFTPFRY